MVADNFREAGTRLLTPLARNFPLDPMGISLLSLATAIGAGYCFAKATPVVAVTSCSLCQHTR